MTNNTFWTTILPLFNKKQFRVQENNLDGSNDYPYSVLKPGSSATLDYSPMPNNPLLCLPFDVRDSLSNEYYEAGMTSLAQRYFENEYIGAGREEELQKIFNDIYMFAGRSDKHRLSYNLLVVLSQLPYYYLGSWACTLALAATRNKYMDVIELGIRCFENWENREALELLKECSFTESWLQEYANAVCESAIDVRKQEDVLYTKDYSWKMARGENYSSSNVEGYSSGYSAS